MPAVLLVEDRDSLRNMLRSTLEDEGYVVEEAGDGKHALDALRYLIYFLDRDTRWALDASVGLMPDVKPSAYERDVMRGKLAGRPNYGVRRRRGV